MDSIEEQLAVVQETVYRSEDFLNEAKYSESIQESRAAIALSELVIEQSALFSVNLRSFRLSLGESGAKKKATLTRDGMGIVYDLANGWKRYIVKKKDCLWCIAERPEVYNTGFLWKRIYKVNKAAIEDPDLIYPGEILYIPPKTGTIGSIPKPNDKAAPAKESSKEATSNPSFREEPSETSPYQDELRYLEEEGDAGEGTATSVDSDSVLDGDNSGSDGSGTAASVDSDTPDGDNSGSDGSGTATSVDSDTPDGDSSGSDGSGTAASVDSDNSGTAASVDNSVLDGDSSGSDGSGHCRICR